MARGRKNVDTLEARIADFQTQREDTVRMLVQERMVGEHRMNKAQQHLTELGIGSEEIQKIEKSLANGNGKSASAKPTPKAPTQRRQRLHPRGYKTEKVQEALKGVKEHLTIAQIKEAIGDESFSGQDVSAGIQSLSKRGVLNVQDADGRNKKYRLQNAA